MDRDVLVAVLLGSGIGGVFLFLGMGFIWVFRLDEVGIMRFFDGAGKRCLMNSLFRDVQSMVV